MMRAIYRSTWWAELWSAAVAIGWAFAFFVGDEPLTVSAPHTFRALERLAPGDVWAWYCLTVGTGQLLAVAFDCREARWVGAIIMAWFPCTSVISMLLSDHLTPHIAVYSGWAGINLYSMFRPLRLVR